jgi:hypothetical protein
MDNLSDRYDKWYKIGDVDFYLSDFFPNPQEIKIIFLKLIEQAIRDYTSLEEVDLIAAQELWESARDFLFDDDYYMNWGEREINLEMIAEILDIELDWLRDQAKRKYRRIKDGEKRNRRNNRVR